MVAFPHCKINLGLNIVSKRADGYHNIVSCFLPVPWTDILEVIPSERFSFESSGAPIPGDSNSNLCIKAYELLRADFKLPPVKIHLHKVIPTGAGLGGGSSDAAFTLRLLNQIFDLKLSVQQLRDYASKLGSDCAFFIEDKPMIGEGRGEQLSKIEINLKGKFLVLVKPDIHVSTAEAYAGVAPAAPVKPLVEILSLPVALWKDVLVNDFEKTVFRKFPAIENTKTKMYDAGALYASMSGSGSTVFGVFNEPKNLQSVFPNMDYWSGIYS